MRIGINTYGLQDYLNNSLPETFSRLKQIGFDEAELVVWPDRKQGKLPQAIATEESIGRMISFAHENSLEVNSVHILCAFGPILANVKDVAHVIRVLNSEHGIKQFVFSGMFSSAWKAKRFARYMNQISSAVRDLDCVLLYHNHNHEFRSIAFKGHDFNALDCFFKNVSSDVLLQLDVGWAGIGGDETEITKKYAGKIVSLHLKDFISGTKSKFSTNKIPKEYFSSIGDGEISIDEILAMHNDFPQFTGSIIIDQDQSNADMMEDIEKGFHNINSMIRKEA